MKSENSTLRLSDSFLTFDEKKSNISNLTKVSTTVQIGLNGLAGKPEITSNESEGWIIDPRTPIKKFSALLYKLASVRHMLFEQLNREFS